MKTYKLMDLIQDVISGEWGREVSDDSPSIKVIRSTNFSNEGKVNLEKEVIVRDIEPEKVFKKHLIIGDTIIEKSGGGPGQPVGRVVFFEESGTYLCNNFTSILRPNTTLVEPKYLMYLLFNLYQRREVLKFQNQTTGIINLQLDQYLKKTEVNIPSKEIQLKMVNALDQSSLLIGKRQSQITALDELTQSVFLEMFGDPNVKGKYPKAPLSDFGEIITGNTPPRKEKDNYGEFIEWIKSDNINTPYTYLTQAAEYLSEKGMEKGRLAPEQSILVTCIAGSKSCIGNVAIADRSVAFNQQINAIIPKGNPYYLYAHFIVGKSLIQQASTNGMKGLVSKGVLKNIEFVLPPIKEQNRFGEIFLAIEEQRTLLEKSLRETNELNNSLLQKSFKGELFQESETENIK